MAGMLALFFPGLGHLYAGRPAAFAAFLGLEIACAAKGWWFPLIILHAFQVVGAAGAAKLWNRRNAAALDLGVPPPPVRRGGTPVRVEIPPPPPRVPEILPKRAPVVYDAAGLLEELRAAWTAHRSGDASGREFADRKWRAIRAVRVADDAEAKALVAAAQELASAGVLTTEEVGMLASQVGA